MAALAVAAASCENPDTNNVTGRSAAPALVIGVGQTSIPQLTQLLSVENLVRAADDGSIEPLLAQSWTYANEGRTLLIKIRPNVRFHDGSLLSAPAVAPLITDGVKAFGTVDEIQHVRSIDDMTLAIDFKHNSPFALESLEVPIRKPGNGAVSTGPFIPVRDTPNELRANREYYLGAPRISTLDIKAFPSVRSAWAELLRNRIDMLYEVGPDALDSLQSSTTIAVFKFVRQYQFTLVFNRNSKALHAREIRRALNAAIDRGEFVRRALNGHAIPSSGPIWPQYWALGADSQKSVYAPNEAAKTLGRAAIRFTCLVPSDDVYERTALELKRQFAAVNVEMQVRSATISEIAAAQRDDSIDAVLVDRVAGPGLLRLRIVWDTRSTLNPRGGNATIDSAFDELTTAGEGDYRHAVAKLQSAFIEDPPALFLAWSERARAISHRFEVPTPEPGADIVRTLRLWTPRNVSSAASRN